MSDTENRGSSPVRLDKWLKIACIFKTRSQATEACARGRVKVNGSVAKPHRVLNLDDKIEIEHDDWSRILVVKARPDIQMSKADARKLYEDLTPARAPADSLQRLLRRPPVMRPRGAGRPTKKDRRLLPRWDDGDQ